MFTPLHFPKVAPNTNQRWYMWTDLTPQRQNAALALGWKLPQEWNERYIPDAFIKSWYELTDIERRE